jgi:hypothetical protein
LSIDVKDLTLNRFPNPNAQFSVGNAVAFADAAATTPADGTGGSPTNTITRTESTPLEGSASFLYTAGLDTQGQGWSFDVNLEASDATKMFTLKFDYQITTGAYVGYQTGASFSDLTVWFYDVTNSLMYQLAPYQIDGTVSTTNQYSYEGQVQVPVGCLKGRVIFYQGNATNAAFTARFNNITFGRIPRVQGSIETDPTLWAVGVTGFGTISASEVYWWRSGNYFNFQGKFQTGTVGASVIVAFALPNGIAASTGFTSVRAIGQIFRNDASVSYNMCLLHIAGGGTMFNVGGYIAGGSASGGAGNLSSTVGSIVSSNQTLTLSGQIPILGWGANGTLGQDADTRVVAAKYAIGTTTFVQNNVNINYGTKDYDTHSAVTTGATWKFTAPVAGVYQVNGVYSVASILAQLVIMKNGVAAGWLISLTNNSGEIFPFSSSLYLNAGDWFGIANGTGSTQTLINASTYNYLCINRLSGPAQVQAPEMIAARYSSNAGQSIGSGGSPTIIDFEDKSYDSHGCVTIGASWKFTAPRAGRVRISSRVTYTSGGGWASGEQANLYIYKNAAEYSGSINVQSASHGNEIGISIEDEVDVLAGDTIDIRTYQNSGAALTLTTTSSRCYASFNYVGGIS